MVKRRNSSVQRTCGTRANTRQKVLREGIQTVDNDIFNRPGKTGRIYLNMSCSLICLKGGSRRAGWRICMPASSPMVRMVTMGFSINHVPAYGLLRWLAEEGNITSCS
jgi:hypothetical protein